MDWTKLTPQQLVEFLQLYKVIPQSNNLPAQAQKLFNQVIYQFGNRAVFTEPVIDLYITSNFKGTIPQNYTPETIRNLSPQLQQQFADVLGLPSITLERLLRILGFLNALDLSSPMNDMPTDIDYLLALNLDYLSLLNFCKSQIKYTRICSDNNFWRQKADHDFGIEPQTFNVRNGRQEYLKLAAQRELPIPGVEKYLTNPENRLNVLEAAFQSENQKLIDYFAYRMPPQFRPDFGKSIRQGPSSQFRSLFPRIIQLASLAGKYANTNMINRLLSESQYNPQQYASVRDAILLGAAEGGQRDIVHQMLGLQAGGQRLEPLGALIAAAGGGYLDIINDLLIYMFNRRELNQAMVAAATNGHLAVVNKMIELRADDICCWKWTSSCRE